MISLKLKLLFYVCFAWHFHTHWSYLLHCLSIKLTLGMVSHCAISALCGDLGMVARQPGAASCSTRSYSPLVSRQRLCLSYTMSSEPYSFVHLLSGCGAGLSEDCLRRFVAGSVGIDILRKFGQSLDRFCTENRTGN